MSVDFMRALTVTQPWAGLIAAGIKLVENRPRPLIKRESFGKPFAIHASREIDGPTYDRIFEIAPELGAGVRLEDHWWRLSRITSAVVAVATIVDVEDVRDQDVHALLHDLAPAYYDHVTASQRRWFFGPVGYVLRDVRVLSTPVPCRGWQAFWYLTTKELRDRGQVSAVERAVQEQVC